MQQEPDARTSWTVILRAQGAGAEAEEAWHELLIQYRGHVRAIVGRWFQDDPDGLTDAFISGPFLRNLIPKAQPENGRFRCFLGFALRCFLTDELRKRGRRIRETVLPESDSVLAADIGQVQPAEIQSDLDWKVANHVFSRALESVRKEFLARGGEAGHFEMLIGRNAGLSQKEIAGVMSITENYARVLRHRLRNRLREEFRREVTAMVDERVSGDVSDELNYLASLLQMKAPTGLV